MLGVGDIAPDFRLKDVQGRAKSLADLTALKPALIAFFKISCPVCQYTFPFLERLAAGGNLEVAGISQDDVAGTEEFRSEWGITFTTLLDEKRAQYPASNGFGITHVPSLFLVEPGGRISMVGNGFCRRDLEAIGAIAGIQPFRPGERIPEFKAG